MYTLLARFIGSGNGWCPSPKARSQNLVEEANAMFRQMPENPSNFNVIDTVVNINTRLADAIKLDPQNEAAHLLSVDLFRQAAEINPCFGYYLKQAVKEGLRCCPSSTTLREKCTELALDEL